MGEAGAALPIPRSDSLLSWSDPWLPRRSMADISKFSIVTYERKPGHWRAAITRRAAAWQCRPGRYGAERRDARWLRVRVRSRACSPKAHKTTLMRRWPTIPKPLPFAPASSAAKWAPAAGSSVGLNTDRASGVSGAFSGQSRQPVASKPRW